MEVDEALPAAAEAASPDAAAHEAAADSSGSDSDSDSESGDALRIEALELRLQEQPLDYDAHVQYIQSLRKSGQIEKLRAARETMSAYFPLSPSMWREWASDEVSVAASDDTFSDIEKLYERGVQDYMSVQLWLDYINFLQEHDKDISQLSFSGIAKMRDLFERALTSAGLHTMEGCSLWEAYRDFEQAILLSIPDDNGQEKEKQVQRVRSLFHRQLSIPMVNLRSRLIDYKVWESQQGNENNINDDLDGVPPTVAASYRKAIEMYNSRKQFEDDLANQNALEDDKLKIFMNYIKFEEACRDPARVQILYERAVSEFPVSIDLWKAYTTFLEGTLKVPSILQAVYHRATRNCSWVSELWIRYLLCLERIHASEEELRHVFEQSLQCSFSSVKEYLDLFLARIHGLRRMLSKNSTEHVLDFQIVRKTFKDAAEFLSAQLSTDDLLRFHSYWARLEAKLGKDISAARGVWENLLKSSGTSLEVWQQYIAMEIEMGNLNDARALYKKCYTKRFAGSGSEDICHSWVRFEEEYGSIEDFDIAVKKVTPRLKELMSYKIQQENKNDNAFHMKKQVEASTSSPQKRKPNQMSSKQQPFAKKKKDNAPKSKQSEPVRNNKMGIGTVVTVVSKDRNSPMEVDAVVLKQEGNATAEPKSRFYNDQCTAFISNINLKANEEHLRNFFSHCGGVVAIRLLHDKFTGKSRGLAYVDFSDNEHLEAAVAMNKQTLLGKKLSIARSDPKKSKNSSTGVKSSKGHDQGFDGDDGQKKAPTMEKIEGKKYSGDLQLTGKNTFAAPRALVRPLGWNKAGGKTDEESEAPKSNDEFRNLLLKK